MNTKRLISICLVSICIISGGYIFSQSNKRYQNSKLLATQDLSMLSGRKGHLTQDMQSALQNTLAYQAFHQGKYAQALAMLSGDDEQSIYNRATILTLRAYEQGASGNLSGLTQASTRLAEAQTNFLLLSQKHTKLGTASLSNLEVTKNLDTVLTAKTCYLLGHTTIQNISGLIQALSASATLLDQEADLIDHANAPKTCAHDRKTSLQQSQDNIAQVQDILHSAYQDKQSDLTRKAEQPELCLTRPDLQSIKAFEQSSQQQQAFQLQHQQSTALWKSHDTAAITALCASKNDSQLDQSLQSSMEEVLKSLGVNSTQGADMNTSSQPHYIPLSQDQQKLLETSKKNNTIWIRQIQRLQADPKYHSATYLKTLFQEFYGNTGDFNY